MSTSALLRSASVASTSAASRTAFRPQAVRLAPRFAAARSPRSRGSLRCAAAVTPNPTPVKVVAEAIDLFLKRYDVVSTGVGALAVTAYCVARGQDPFTALSITFGATILGLVLNEVMFNTREN